MSDTQINLRLPEDTLKAVDEARGDIPRNKWILRAVEAKLLSESGGLTSSSRADAFRKAAKR